MQLRAKTAEFKKRLQEGQTLADIEAGLVFFFSVPFKVKISA